MRNAPNMRVEKFRVREGDYGSDSIHLNNGAFILTMRNVKISGVYLPDNMRAVKLFVVISDQEGWDHCSVSVDVNPPRCPTWEEMCYVKTLFFKDEETVVQFHPKKSEYVNCHKYVLHLWRKQDKEYELPPSEFVGPKEEVSNDRRTD